MVMNELKTLVEQNRFSEVADLLEGSDSPLDSRVWDTPHRAFGNSGQPHFELDNIKLLQNEDIDLWLLLILGHVMSHKWCVLVRCSAVYTARHSQVHVAEQSLIRRTSSLQVSLSHPCFMIKMK